MGACQIATQACHLRPESAHRHGRRRVTRAQGHHRQHQRLNHRIRGALGFFSGQCTHLHQAHGKRGQQTRASGSDRHLFAIVAARCDSHL